MLEEGKIISWDNRRDVIVIGEPTDAIAFSAEHWIHCAKRSILEKGHFFVALSGGSTPQPIYAELAAKHSESIDWSKVFLFWSDERAVPPDHARSNYRAAMESGFSKLPIPAGQILRMKAESHRGKNSADYEDLIQRTCGPHLLDLVMLGVGDDGHTASLFPKSAALEEEQKLVVPNEIPELNEWRMTFTYPCINKSHLAVVHAFGSGKQAIIPLVLNAAISSSFPSSKVGAPEHKALWVLDRAAAKNLSK